MILYGSHWKDYLIRCACCQFFFLRFSFSYFPTLHLMKESRIKMKIIMLNINSKNFDVMRILHKCVICLNLPEVVRFGHACVWIDGWVDVKEYTPLDVSSRCVKQGNAYEEDIHATLFGFGLLLHVSEDIYA
jgi:hypothetical protein